jgi:MFS family permease
MAGINPVASTPPSPSSPGAAASGIIRALRHRNFRLFFGGQLISLVGTFLTQIATVWFVYRLTKDTRLLGIVGFAGQLPMFLLAPFAGVWADRVNRQRFIVLTQVLSMLQSFGLAAVAFFFGRPGHIDTHIAVPSLIGLAIIQGLINAFDMPARQAFLVEMVTDRADLANAIALNSTMVHGARLIGPAAAGLIIAAVGESLCFFIDAVSYIAVIAALLAMRVTPRPPREPKSIRYEIVEGARYVWNFAPIRALLLLMALLSLTGMPAVSTLMPIFGDHFGGGTPQRGAQVFGFLGTMSGLGALAGALYLASRKTVVGLGTLIAIAAGTFGIGAIAFASSDRLWLSLLILPIAGWGMITCFASANTILQMLADDDKRGRVMSFFSMAFVGMAPFGNLLAGFAAYHLSPVVGTDAFRGASRTVICAGVICVIAAVSFAAKLPALREIVRPIYITKGILPQVAGGLQTTDTTPGGAGEQ